MRVFFIVSEVRLDAPLFGDFLVMLVIWSFCVQEVTRRAFTCCFSYNAQRVIRKRENEELYEFAVI